MSDAERRRLERAVAAGDPDALPRLHELLRRTGEVRRFDEAIARACAHTRPPVLRSGVVQVVGDALEHAPTTRTLAALTSAVIARVDGEQVEVIVCARDAGPAPAPFLEQPDVAEELIASDPGRVRVQGDRFLAGLWLREHRPSSGGPAGPRWAHPRERPAMYFGSTGLAGVHGLLDLVLLACVAERVRGHATRLDVDVRACGEVVVSHDGRGVLPRPTGASHVMDLPDLLGGLTTPEPKLPGLHAEGFLAAACAAAREFDITLTGDGGARRQRFERGQVVSDLESVAATFDRGVTFRLRVDPEVFAVTEPDAALLECRLAQIAALCPGLTTSLRVGGGPPREQRDDDGIVALLRRLWTRGALDPPARGAAHQPVAVDVAFTFGARARDRIDPMWRALELLTHVICAGAQRSDRLLLFQDHHASTPTGPIRAGLQAGVAASAPAKTSRAAVDGAAQALVGVVHVRARVGEADGDITRSVRDAVVSALAAADPAQVAALWTRARRKRR